MNIYDELKWRGLIADLTEGLKTILAQEKLTGYIGFDPSSASLHVGSLLPIMGLARLQRYGHTPLAIIGGGTGLIGDPSGKQEERLLLTTTQVDENLVSIREQLARFLDFEVKANPAQIVNNAEWLTTIGLTDFLREIGKYFTVNGMLAKESIKRRLGQPEGISFTEFSYMLLQAYDFLMLHDRYGCTLQMGGSDQWGNITAGMDLIRRLRSVKAYGLVFPLLTTASGVKFGKTEKGTVWLDACLTSPFRFYQFWLNVDDTDVFRYLEYLTWVTENHIQELEMSMQMNPEQRQAQRVLAREITGMVHGTTALSYAERASQVLFGEDCSALKAEEIIDIFGDAPSIQIPKSRLEGQGISLVELGVLSGLTASKSEAGRLIRGGGLYLNNIRVPDDRQTISATHLIEGRMIVLRKGKKDHCLIYIVN